MPTSDGPSVRGCWQGLSGIVGCRWYCVLGDGAASAGGNEAAGWCGCLFSVCEGGGSKGGMVLVRAFMVFAAAAVAVAAGFGLLSGLLGLGLCLCCVLGACAESSWVC